MKSRLPAAEQKELEHFLNEVGNQFNMTEVPILLQVRTEELKRK